MTFDQCVGVPVAPRSALRRMAKAGFSLQALADLLPTHSLVRLLGCANPAEAIRINLKQVSDVVRDEIVGGRIPLGRALIRHNVLRHVELQRLWRVNPGPALREYLQLSNGEPIYGRSARIVVEGRPAVELLEIPRA